MKRLVTILLLLLTAASSLAAERFPHGRWSVGLDAVGDIINGGEPLFTIHANDAELLTQARETILKAHLFSDDPVAPLPLFYE